MPDSASRNAGQGAMSLIWSQVISIVVVAGFLAIGLLLYIFYQRPDLMGAHVGANPPSDVSVYPWFLLKQMPTIVSGIAMAGFFAIAQGSMDSAINALASSAVADVYLPLRRRASRGEDASHNTALPMLAVAFMGLLMTGLGIICVFCYDPKSHTLIDFALGVMTFAFTGMLAVFLTALLTRRGNTASVIAALVVGIFAVVLMQDSILAAWSTKLLGHPIKLAWTWWTPIGTLLAMGVCVAGRPSRTERSKATEINNENTEHHQQARA